MYFDYPKNVKGQEKYCPAAIGKINPRAEKHGNDKKPAMDINLKISLPAAELVQFSLGDNPDYTKFFDEKGQVGNHGVKELIFKREYENHSLGISFSAVKTVETAERFRLDKLKILSAEFKNGSMVDLYCQAQFHPNEKDSGMLCFRGNSVNECWVNVRHEQEDLATEAGPGKGSVTNIKSRKPQQEEIKA